MSAHYNVAGIEFSTIEDAAHHALNVCDPPRLILEYVDVRDEGGELEGYDLVNAYAWDAVTGAWYIVPQDRD